MEEKLHLTAVTCTVAGTLVVPAAISWWIQESADVVFPQPIVSPHTLLIIASRLHEDLADDEGVWREVQIPREHLQEIVGVFRRWGEQGLYLIMEPPA